jgi:hypothetical protein
MDDAVWLIVYSAGSGVDPPVPPEVPPLFPVLVPPEDNPAGCDTISPPPPPPHAVKVEIKIKDQQNRIIKPMHHEKNAIA